MPTDEPVRKMYRLRTAPDLSFLKGANGHQRLPRSARGRLLARPRSSEWDLRLAGQPSIPLADRRKAHGIGPGRQQVDDALLSTLCSSVENAYLDLVLRPPRGKSVVAKDSPRGGRSTRRMRSFHARGENRS